MRPLIIGTMERLGIAEVVNYAKKHRIDVDEMLDICNGQAAPVGDRPKYSLLIPVGFRVVFCIEHQKRGWARHISISVHPKRKGKCANPAAISEIMKEFGFKNSLKECAIYFEGDDNSIVNVVEYL